MRVIYIWSILVCMSCTSGVIEMKELSERYVKLVLRVGLHDADYVDAYYGPKTWRPDSSEIKSYTLDKLLKEANLLLTSLASRKEDNEMGMLRISFLRAQLTAVKTKLEMLSGKEFSFDSESQGLYDSKAPTYDRSHFEKILTELGHRVPGSGDLAQRLETFRQKFAIPKDKLDIVFQTAIAEGRRRTEKFITLQKDESFKVEYVTNKAWSGYNWYQGNGFSVIQINTDLPIYIDRAVDLACHEGYPGHHVYNALLEKHLVVDLGWTEFSVYPLFSPQSLIAEGSANYGIEMAFPNDERVKFEREVLFPLAGIDSKNVDLYYEVLKWSAKLSYSGNEAARNYLDGQWTKEQAIDWLMKYGLYSRERAEQRIRFVEKYRSYVINYNYGLDLVKNYVESQATKESARWPIFTRLLSTPQTPSHLHR